MKIINLTPHTVNILSDCGTSLNIKSEGIARCSQTTVPVGYINNIPVTSTSFGEVEGLPKEQEGTFYIVSRLIMSACKNRHDLLVPNELVRDEQVNH